MDEKMSSELNCGDFAGLQTLFRKLTASFFCAAEQWVSLTQNFIILVGKSYRW